MQLGLASKPPSRTFVCRVVLKVSRESLGRDFNLEFSRMASCKEEEEKDTLGTAMKHNAIQELAY